MNKWIASMTVTFLLFAPAVADTDKSPAPHQPASISSDFVNHCNGRVRPVGPVVNVKSEVSHNSPSDEAPVQTLRVVPAPTQKAKLATR